MFDEIRFNTIERLPNYVFAEVNAIKMAARRAGEDIIDFSMGNPEGRTPQHIVDKLCESAQKDKTHGYSASAGIYKLRLAICNWYKRKYGVNLDPDTEAVAVMGSKEGFVHLAQAVINPGDVAVVPDPAYPIHTQAFLFAGGSVAKMPLKYNDKFELDENKFFEDLLHTIRSSSPKPKYVVVNFPHNPTTVTVQKSFYERLVAMSKQERFYVISDIAYADLTFEGYKTPSIFEVEGAKDVAKNNINYYQGKITPVFARLKIKDEWVLDGIEVFKVGQKNNQKRLTAKVDAGYVNHQNAKGYTLYRNVDPEATKAVPGNEAKLVYKYDKGTEIDGKASTDPSGIDAEASLKKGARIIYMDSNNSTKDFHQRRQSSLKD